MPQRSAKHGFTLTELLIVMMIIGVLVSLLVPTVSRAIRMVRGTMTRWIMDDIGLGLEAYKADFGDYPPSEYDVSYPQTGAEKLVFYLRGPRGDGWGAGAAGHLPEHTAASRPRTRTYGPYYQADEDGILWEKVVGNTVPVAFVDAFKPPGRIIYFKAGRNDDGITTYQWDDNGSSGTEVQQGWSNYPSEERFYEWTTKKGTSSVPTDGAYYRHNYLLVSPGQDGRFGAIKRDENGNVSVATREEVENGEGSYDDITNWN